MSEKGRGAPKKTSLHRQAKRRQTPAPQKQHQTSPLRTKGCGNNKFARRRDKEKRGKHPLTAKQKGRQSPRPSKTTPNFPAAKQKGGGQPAPRKQPQTSPPRTTGSGNNKFARRRDKEKGGTRKTLPLFTQAKGTSKLPPPNEKERHSPRPRKQQKNSSSARPHGGGIYLPNRGGPFRHFSA